MLTISMLYAKKVSGLSEYLWSLFSFFSTIHGLVASGGEDGAVECFDMRKKSSVGRINAVMTAGGVDQVVLQPNCYCL